MPHLIRQSYARIAPKTPEVIADLYRRLFARRPDTRAMFRREMGNQHGKFAATLELCVMAEDDPAQTGALLRRLGARHDERGVTDDLFPVFIDCLVEAIAAHLGDEWTPAHDAAWRAALTDIGERMQGRRDD